MLTPLTVIHNYAIPRRDGTVAERFAGKKHVDLFAHGRRHHADARAAQGVTSHGAELMFAAA